MAFPKLNFKKSWKSPVDFPTYEASETQVRADLQELHDETAEYINTEMADYIEKSYMPKTGGAVEGDLRMGSHSIAFDGASIGNFDFDRGVLGLRGPHEEDITLRGVASPIEDNDAANKDYVDSSAAVLWEDLADYADDLVDSLSEDLPSRFFEKGKDIELDEHELWAKLVHADFLMAMRGLEVDENSHITFGGNRVQDVGAPVEDLDAVNKAYVESYANGLNPIIHGTWDPSSKRVTLEIPPSAPGAYVYLSTLHGKGKRPELQIEGDGWTAIFRLSKVSSTGGYLQFSNTERWDDGTLSISTITVNATGIRYTATEF